MAFPHEQPVIPEALVQPVENFPGQQAIIESAPQETLSEPVTEVVSRAAPVSDTVVSPEVVAALPSESVPTSLEVLEEGVDSARVGVRREKNDDPLVDLQSLLIAHQAESSSV